MTASLTALLKPLAERQLPDSFAHLVGLHAQALVNALVPLGTREYSIASVAADGVLQLIVRQAVQADGSLGLGSGWLTEHLPTGGQVLARVRRNSGFHLLDDDRLINRAKISKFGIHLGEVILYIERLEQ